MAWDDDGERIAAQRRAHGPRSAGSVEVRSNAPISADGASRDCVLGQQDALLGVRSDNSVERIPPARTRPVVNTIGAGDALFSCFLHFYRKTRDPYDAIRKAVVFASYKIGESGAAQGFLTEAELRDLHSTGS